jgi:hypothetical protein
MRAVWCLLGNHSTEIIGQEWRPINRIRLGPVHTVHSHDDEPVGEEVWFEPTFSPVDSFSATGQFGRSARYILGRLDNTPYAEILKEALVRYVQALDQPNQRNALIRLWSALELLTLGRNVQAEHDIVVRRIASLFAPELRAYHQQILQHLREARNDTVHQGADDESKRLCYQLQFYFFRLFIFLLNFRHVARLDEAHQFLDLPSDKASIDQRLRLLRYARRFRSAPSKSSSPAS